jgi:tripartite-type tricarboxylate transporter receptor subunit TctC
VADLVAEMKAHPGKLSYASGGYGTPAHLVAAQLLLQTNTSAVHVPYNQFSQTLGDVATGRVDFMVLNAPSAVPQVASGRLKALAITSPKRNPALPNVPSFAEIGLPEVAVRGWDGLVALKGTPPDVAARLGKELSLALADKDLQKEMLRSQTEPAPSDAATFAKLIDDELAHWEVVVKKANIRLDK